MKEIYNLVVSAMKPNAMTNIIFRIILATLVILPLAANPTGQVFAAACTSLSSGNWQDAGTWDCGHSPVVGDTATIATGHIVTLGGAGGAWWVDSTTVNSGGTLALTRGIRNSGTFTVNGTLSIDTGGFVENIAPTYSSTSLLKYNSGGSYNRSLEWSTTAGAGYPFHVQVSNSTALDASSGVAVNRDIAGNLTIDTGSSLSLGSISALPLIVRGHFSNSGTLTMSPNSNFELYGNWTNTGTFTPSDRTVWFRGSSAQTVNGNATTFARIDISNAAGVTLNTNATINPSTNLPVPELVLTSGDLNTGSQTLTLGSVVDCSGTFDVVGNVQRTTITHSTNYCFGHPDNQITFANLGTLPTSVSVALTKAQPAGFLTAINRFYSITLGGTPSGYSATLQLRYLFSEITGDDINQIKLWRKDGLSWTNVGADSRDTTPPALWVQKLNVTAFSDWTFSDQTPTAITLRNITSESARNNSLALMAAAMALLFGGAVLAAKRRRG